VVPLIIESSSCVEEMPHDIKAAFEARCSMVLSWMALTSAFIFARSASFSNPLEPTPLPFLRCRVSHPIGAVETFPIQARLLQRQPQHWLHLAPAFVHGDTKAALLRRQALTCDLQHSKVRIQCPRTNMGKCDVNPILSIYGAVILDTSMANGIFNSPF
jgi:hypothetical protein